MRIGLLGAGRIGAFHAATLLDSPDVTDLVVGDVDPPRAAALAEKLAAGQPRPGRAVSGGDVDAVFAAAPDAVLIAAATSAHAELVIRAARAGLPAFCEKPIALDVAGTRAALSEVDTAGSVLQVGFQRRFDPAYVAARAALAAGELGRLYTIRMVGSDREPPPEEYLPTSGGIFRDLHIHDFDITRWVTGREVTGVHAVGANRESPAFGRNGDFDTTAVLLTLDDGTLVTLTGSRYNAAGYDFRMELSGSGGTVVIGLDDRSPVRSADPAVQWPADSPYTGFLDRFGAAYMAEVQAFLDVARGSRPNPCDGTAALEALYIAEAAQLSATTGRTVTLAEVR
jgi:myo-inositol 2-dehydrogenase/D-chiro-inositol 1-dehydrogenase